jgi:hypothetical protein
LFFVWACHLSSVYFLYCPLQPQFHCAVRLRLASNLLWRSARCRCFDAFLRLVSTFPLHSIDFFFRFLLSSADSSFNLFSQARLEASAARSRSLEDQVTKLPVSIPKCAPILTLSTICYSHIHHHLRPHLPTPSSRFSLRLRASPTYLSRPTRLLLILTTLKGSFVFLHHVTSQLSPFSESFSCYFRILQPQFFRTIWFWRREF